MREMKVENINLDEMHIHAGNVRQDKSSDEFINRLAASIESVGLINPLTVIDEGGGKYKVIAGRNRYKALKRLRDSGKEVSNCIEYQIPCAVLPDTAYVPEISMIENTHRDAMSMADQIVTFGMLHKAGNMSVEEISKRFGITMKEVKQCISLGTVMPEAIKMFRDEEISLDALKVLTMNPDHQKQKEAIKSCQGRITAWGLKSFFRDDKMTADNRFVRFIGLDTYKKAGGKVLEDLFDEKQTIIEDGSLVMNLVADKLGKRKAELFKEGWTWVSLETDENFAKETDQIYSHYTRVWGEEPKLTDKEKKRIAELDELIDDVNIVGDEYDKYWDEREKLEATIESRRSYSSETMKEGLIRLDIGMDGEIDHEVFIKRPDKDSSADDDSREKSFYSWAHECDLKAIRSNIVQNRVMEDSVLARDILGFNLAMAIQSHFTNEKHQDRFGSIGIGNVNILIDIDDKIMKRYENLDKKWLHEDIVERFEAWRAMEAQKKNAWICFAVGASIRVDLDESIALHTNLVEPMNSILPALKIGWCDEYRPDASYFAKLNKDKQLQMMRPILGAGWCDMNKDLKTKSLAQRIADAFAGKYHGFKFTKEQIDNMRDWSPPGFDPDIDGVG